MPPDEARIDADLRWLDGSGCTLLASTARGIPATCCAQSPDAPAVLYVRGERDRPSPSRSSRWSAAAIPPRAAARPRASSPPVSRASGLAITSGLALGIDAACHEGALDAEGVTIAVLGHGLDIIYPREHQQLAGRIAASGALVSEFPPGTPPLPRSFSAAQSHHRRAFARHPGGRSRAGFRFADHGAPRRSRGPRGVRHPRIHPQSRSRAVATNSSAREPSWWNASRTCWASSRFPFAAPITCGRRNDSLPTRDVRGRVGQGIQNPVRCARLRAGKRRQLDRTHGYEQRIDRFDAADSGARRTRGAASRRPIQPHGGTMKPTATGDSMTGSVLDILIYVFDQYMLAEMPRGPGARDPGCRSGACRVRPSQRRTRARLARRSRRRTLASGHVCQRALRVFSEDELERISTECRGYLLQLEREGILSPLQREIVIDRLLALDGDEVDIDQLKWLVLMVLSSQPGQEQACARMEDLVFEDPDALPNWTRWLTTWSSSSRPPRRRPSRSTSARISRCSPPMATCAIWCPRKARSIPTSTSR